MKSEKAKAESVPAEEADVERAAAEREEAERAIEMTGAGKIAKEIEEALEEVVKIDEN